MNRIYVKRHRFRPEVIRYGAWLYFRFTLGVRGLEELLAEHGIEVSREAIRCWAIKFGPLIAANLRRRRCAPTGRWHLGEIGSLRPAAVNLSAPRGSLTARRCAN